MQTFRNIGLIGRKGNQGVIDSLHYLIKYLSSRSELQIIFEESTALLIKNEQFQRCPRHEMSSYCDLVIVVGGDGSMLKVAPELASQNIPVVGINRGKLGFLTDILPEEIEARMDQVLEGDYKVESRFLLEVSLQKKSGNKILGSALNDVVLHPGNAAQMIEFALYIDDEFVYNQTSDGLIVATPTGSTAYSMSAGGPIMQPRLDAVVLVPMYPHTLSSRPIVIDANSDIAIVVGNRHNMTPQISCDGTVVLTCKPGDRITITKKGNPLKLIHPADYNYYETCRSKLGWSSRLGKYQDSND